MTTRHTIKSIQQLLTHHRPNIPSQQPFRIHTQTKLSTRALTSHLRSQNTHSLLRTALACEASSLRYSLLLTSVEEEMVVRGWDAGVCVEDEDGTWVSFSSFCGCLSVYDVSAMVLSCDVFIEIVIILILHVFDCMCFIIFSHWFLIVEVNFFSTLRLILFAIIPNTVPRSQFSMVDKEWCVKVTIQAIINRYVSPLIESFTIRCCLCLVNNIVAVSTCTPQNSSPMRNHLLPMNFFTFRILECGWTLFTDFLLRGNGGASLLFWCVLCYFFVVNWFVEEIVMLTYLIIYSLCSTTEKNLRPPPKQCLCTSQWIGVRLLLIVQ